MGPALMVGAAFIALGALVVLFFLPARAEEQAELEAADLDAADLDAADLDAADLDRRLDAVGELGLAGVDA
jgi:hypothetical protein